MRDPFVTVRASAVGDFFDCPARAEARHLLGKHCPTSGTALLGKAIHASTAVYDQSTLDGTGISIDEAAAAAVDTIYRPNEEVALDDDESTRVMEHIAIALHERYCEEIAPLQTYIAVEVQCDRVEIADLRIALTGHADRVRTVMGSVGITDLKSGKTAVAADGTVSVKGHTYQLGIYELLAESALDMQITQPAQVVGMQTGKTARGQRIGTAEISGARDVLIGDAEVPGILETLAHMIHAGNFPGNPRSMMCAQRYCPIYHTCRYRK